MTETALRFDKARWGQEISRPDWYLRYVPYADEALEFLAKRPDLRNEFLRDSRHFFEAALELDQVALGDSGPDFDAERQPVDTIVIHHTSHTPGYRLPYLNAVHLLNIYAPHFAHPDNRDSYIKGQGIWSGHFDEDGRQVFWGYHWMMRMDGGFQRLLQDEQIGWQAGNWEVNKRSVGICIDNDYEFQDPSEGTLRRLAAHINLNYPGVDPVKIIGHCEANGARSCPGGNYLEGWKPKLIGYLAS